MKLTNINPLSQRDIRWKNVPLGFSDLTIGGYGCTITCIAMIAGLNPDEVNARLKAVNGFASGSLVIWSKIKEAIPWLEFEWRGYSYDNERVKGAVEEYGACLVEVDFDSNKISTPNDKHWVLYVGNQEMIDPWTGAKKSTGWYPERTGFAVIKVSEKPNEIQDEISHNGNTQAIETYQQHFEDLNVILGIQSGNKDFALITKRCSELMTIGKSGGLHDQVRQKYIDVLVKIAKILNSKETTEEGVLGALEALELRVLEIKSQALNKFSWKERFLSLFTRVYEKKEG
jgi:hypothetical protein